MTLPTSLIQVYSLLVGELWPGVGSVPGCDGCGATPLPPPPPHGSLAASFLLSCKYLQYSWINMNIMTSKSRYNMEETVVRNLI